MLRALKGYPPIGSSADADQLSDLEESIEVGKYQMVRFGERYIVQIGRRRTMREEELSNEEDDGRRAAMSAVDAGLSIGADGGALMTAAEDASLLARGNSESGTGPFLGGHTGHAQAELNQRQIAEAGEGQETPKQVRIEPPQLQKQHAQSSSTTGGLPRGRGRGGSRWRR